MSLIDNTNWLTEPQEFFASTALGMEQILAEELNHWQGADPGISVIALRVERGGVSFNCSLRGGFLLNHCLKSAHRILWRVLEFKCNEFSSLKHRLEKIPWNFMVGKPDPVFHVSSESSRLFHKKNIEETCIEAFQTYRSGQPARGKASKSVTNVYIRFLNNRCQVSVDTSGEHLHRRGYKTFSTEAPLRENYAAGLYSFFLQQLKHAPQEAHLIDPMCGSGTFLGEAFHFYRPIFYRKYAYEEFFVVRHIPEFGHRTLKDSAMDPKHFREYSALDVDKKALQAARSNLSPLPKCNIQLESIGDIDGPTPSGELYILSNPPYGARLSKDPKLADPMWLLSGIIEKYSPQAMGILFKASGKVDGIANTIGPYSLAGKLKLNNNGIRTVFTVFEKSPPNS